MNENKFNRDRFIDLKTKAGLSPLASAFYKQASTLFNHSVNEELNQLLKKSFKKEIWQLESVEEFFNPQVKKALRQLTDADFVSKMEEILKLRNGKQFSSSILRRAFRSSDYGFYAVSNLYIIGCLIRLYYYEGSLLEMMDDPDFYADHKAELLALAIRQDNQDIKKLICDMILGDNNTLLSRNVILAIILSDDEALLGLLMDLLLAAKSQEGLRQAVLESADAGSYDTFLKIFSVCIEHDLFRFSSAARALFTWTGLGIETLEIPKTRKLAQSAYRCLTDLAYREEMLVSPNPYDAYLAIWSMGCKEVLDTDRYVETLLTDSKKYRRDLGWYFVSKVENDSYRHQMAVKYLDEPEDEVLAFLTLNFYYTHSACWYSSYNFKKTGVICRPDSHLPASYKERKMLFDRLKELALRIGARKETFEGTPFPWSTVVLSNENADVLRCMVSLADYDLDPYMLGELAKLIPYMDRGLREAFYGNLLEPDKHEEQKFYLYQGLKDRSMDTKIMVIGKLSECSAVWSDVEAVCALLTSKSASLKKAAVNYLTMQSFELRKQAACHLADGNDSQLQAAMELLLQDAKLAENCKELITSLSDRKLSSQAELLLKQLTGLDQTAEELSPENGYGLFDHAAIDSFSKKLAEDPSLTFYENKLFSFKKKEEGAYPYLKKKEIEDMIPSLEELSKVYAGLEEVFVRHKDYEYSTIDYDGKRCYLLFGDIEYSIPIPEQYGQFTNKDSEQIRFDMYPFADEFKAVIKPYLEEPSRFLGLLTAASLFQYCYGEEFSGNSWLTSLHQKYSREKVLALRSSYKQRIYCYQRILDKAVSECDSRKLFDAAFCYYFSFLHILGDPYMEYLKKDSTRLYVPRPAEDSFLQVVFHLLQSIDKDKEAFRLWFLQEYRFRRPHDFCSCHLTIYSFLRALDEGLITEGVFVEWLLHPCRKELWEMKLFTRLYANPGQKLAEDYPWLSDFSKRVTDHIVRFELRRGQAETPISRHVSRISRLEGAGYFNLLLRGLGSDNFFRGYEWSGDQTKSCIFSQLLRCCQPAPGDSAQTLRELLKGSDIKEKRLVEAAMYAPQWAPIIEEYIGWPGLKKGVWFFQAHCSEHFSSDKETEVALFSPITPQEFNDGAFDIDWFRSSYAELGDKRFQALYKAAKYITSGSNAHRRSQLYTDAVTRKLDLNVLEAEIKDKRNQEKLRAYALIPLEADPEDKEGQTRELLHRYAFITRFQKESKQFGALRRESERKAAQTALANLAISSGIGDVDRMLWRLESAKNAELAPLMSPVLLGEYSVLLRIDPEGIPCIEVSKDGKALKSVPKAIAKNAYLEELKQAVKELKEQRSRSRKTLEQAMITRASFSKEELDNIMASPTIAPMVAKLLWINEKGEIGFLGNVTGETLRIVHCHDLAASGLWGDFIRYAIENSLLQPFKQIFREYYPISDEEKEERILSRRYAGYQVQPKKTMGLLKNCGWTVDYEEGLQKVCYSADLVVRMYSNADWFSPADIEAPTLEEIRFYKRRSFEAVPLEEIDPILFSEVMRDFDLVVSLAYVGGVDPEASHSTVEMRAAIAKELTTLLKLDNVSFLERHTRIEGKLGNYSVHLGSGVVHAVGVGMIPILPVHSGQRGRIFLPFADEDPKTAEIMSKIILLSEDHKIKDPEILKYLR